MAKTQINFRASAHTTDQLAELIKKTGMTQTEVIAVAIDRMHQKEIKMNNWNEWAPTASVYRDEFKSEAEYRKAYQECNRKYSFKVRVDGGWKFFQFEDDYRTWKNQK